MIWSILSSKAGGSVFAVDGTGVAPCIYGDAVDLYDSQDGSSALRRRDNDSTNDMIYGFALHNFSRIRLPKI